MWSPLGTLLLTWAAIYAYVGVYFCALHLRRPTHREYLAFGLLSGGLMIWCAGSAIAANAQAVHIAALGLTIEYAIGFFLSPILVQFGRYLAGRPNDWVGPFSYTVGLIGLLIAVGGWLIEPTDAAAGGTAVTGSRLTAIGVVFVLISMGNASYGLWLIAQGSRANPDLRPIAWTAAAAVVGSSVDVASRVVGGDSLYLLDHLALLPVLTVAWVLQRRFVRAADELVERTDELRDSYSELRVVQDELVRKEQLAAVGELSAVIAHEVRNPLAIIKNAVSGLRRPTLRDSDRSVLFEILEEEVDRLNNLVRDLLDYARPVAPKAEDVDLVRLARESAEAVRDGLDQPERITIVVDAPDARHIKGDPALLRQALSNLATNAVHAMPPGGVITIRAAVEGSPPTLRLELQDTGIGMDRSALLKSKDPFFTTRPAGTGLGLAIVERVIRNHGGSVELHSSPGAGTTVTLRLPCDRLSNPPELR